MKPQANGTWFTATVNGRSDFGVYAFEGHEAVSEAYEFVIELVHLSDSEDMNALVGKEAALAFADRSGVPRYLHGQVREACQLHTANLRTHYKITVVPRFWFLNETCNYRIFQHKSVPDIIAQVLEEQGFAGDTFAMKCREKYAQREYCVQYGESDFHFINRLCEEEGIYFYFSHTQSSHCLCFCDYPADEPIAGASALRFFPGSGQEATSPVIARLEACSSCRSNSASFREWNFTLPKLNLSAGEMEPNGALAPVPAGMVLEQYRFPHLYQVREEGERYATLELIRQISLTSWIEGESDVCRFLPGFTFSVTSHHRNDVNGTRWWTLSVRHKGEQPGVLEHEAPDDRGLYYNASFRAIPQSKRYIPASRHAKQLMSGKQTAIVTGADKEEVYPDKYGRVKVQFFWDRPKARGTSGPMQPQWNEKTTCWIRASQEWAGTKYGTEALPRVGHEVIVSFLNGDPDRPIITGRVYNAENMPPYELPANKTRTVFKSMTVLPAGAANPGEVRGYNEFRIEDKKMREEIFIHAQKDCNLHTKNVWKEHILHNRHETVEKFRYTKTLRETHHKVTGNRISELRSEDHLTIRSDQHTSIEGSWLARAGNEIHLESLIKAVVEAGAELTLKTGPSFIHLSSAGVAISGPVVNINSGGSPGEGTPAEPLLPLPANVVPEPLKLQTRCLTSAARQHSAVVEEGNS